MAPVETGYAVLMVDPVETSVTIDAPVSRVMEVLTALEKPERWADEATSVDVRSRDDRDRPSRLVVTLAAIGFTTTATYEVSYGEDTITMDCVDASLIRESTIAYRAHAEGEGRTRLDVAVTMRVAVPVPQWGLNRVIRSNQDKNLASIKKDAEG